MSGRAGGWILASKFLITDDTNRQDHGTLRSLPLATGARRAGTTDFGVLMKRMVLADTLEQKWKLGGKMLDVEESPRFTMTAAPLVQALAQVNFPIVATLQTLDGAAAVQHALNGRYPYLSQNVIQHMSLMVGPAGPAAPQTAQQVVSELTGDDGWTLMLTVSTATLAVGAEYGGVDDFAERFSEVCEALADVGGVARCDRLGVRYLDVIELDDATDGWERWFRPEIVGLASPELTRQALQSSLTETRLQQQPTGPFAALQSPVEGILRHGVVPAGSILAGVPPRPIERRAFILDMDTFIQSPQPLDEDALAEQYRALHGEIEKVFHWAVTPDGREHFGYELVDQEAN